MGVSLLPPPPEAIGVLNSNPRRAAGSSERCASPSSLFPSYSPVNFIWRPRFEFRFLGPRGDGGKHKRKEKDGPSPLSINHQFADSPNSIEKSTPASICSFTDVSEPVLSHTRNMNSCVALNSDMQQLHWSLGAHRF
jgi:hypothetical protein